MTGTTPSPDAPLPGVRQVAGMLVAGAVATGLTRDPLYIGLAAPTALIYLLVQNGGETGEKA